MFWNMFGCGRKSELKMWNPQEPTSLPSCAGNYIFLLRQGVDLLQPQIEEKPVYKTIVYEGVEYNVLYTGISKSNLNKRIIEIHFGDNAGKSTLRKSLGSLRGFDFIPRDKKDNGKTKFKSEDETKITDWMVENLIVLYMENPNYKEEEKELINVYNPPLNIQNNNNVENMNYRNKLCLLRKGK